MMTSSYQMAFTSFPWYELFVESSPYIFKVLAAGFFILVYKGEEVSASVLVDLAVSHVQLITNV